MLGCSDFGVVLNCIEREHHLSACWEIVAGNFDVVVVYARRRSKKEGVHSAVSFTEDGVCVLEVWKVFSGEKVVLSDDLEEFFAESLLVRGVFR